jgi:hypothetical protein
MILSFVCYFIRLFNKMRFNWKQDQEFTPVGLIGQESKQKANLTLYKNYLVIGQVRFPCLDQCRLYAVAVIK